jgi:hypothetical protein
MGINSLPLALAAGYTVTAFALASMGINDIRAYVVIFTLVSLLMEVAFHPIPKPASFFIISVNLVWISWDIYYLMQALGLISG